MSYDHLYLFVNTDILFLYVLFIKTSFFCKVSYVLLPILIVSTCLILEGQL